MTAQSGADREHQYQQEEKRGL